MKIILLSLVLSMGCSQINKNEQDHYKQRKEFFRHGIVPVPLEKIERTDVKRTVNKAYAISGKKLFLKHCMECHGATAKGDGPRSKTLSPAPKDLVEIVRAVPNFKFYMMLSKWTGKMPGWKNLLTDKEILYIENYLLQLAIK